MCGCSFAVSPRRPSTHVAHPATDMPRLPAPDRAVPAVCTGHKLRGRRACGLKSRIRPRRCGVTLLELLVVLVLMAISAALVLPALSAKSVDTSLSEDAVASATASNGQSFLAPDAVIGAILTNTRRLAVKRGEPMRLRVAQDGVWAVVPLKGGPAISDGRAPLPLLWFPDVVVDALGACVLSRLVVAPAGAHAWDALACRWRRATP